MALLGPTTHFKELDANSLQKQKSFVTRAVPGLAMRPQTREFWSSVFWIQSWRPSRPSFPKLFIYFWSPRHELKPPLICFLARWRWRAQRPLQEKHDFSRGQLGGQGPKTTRHFSRTVYFTQAYCYWINAHKRIFSLRKREQRPATKSRQRLPGGKQVRARYWDSIFFVDQDLLRI